MEITMNPTTEPVGARKVNLSAGEMRSDVSKQWFARPFDERFLSINDLLAKVQARREASTEMRVDSNRIGFHAPEANTMEDTHVLSVGLPDGREVAPSNWAFGQLCGLAKAPAEYLRRLPSQIVVDNLTWGLQRTREVEGVKTYDYNGQLIAATGPDYGRIYDEEVVRAVQQIAGNGTGDERWKVPGVMDWSTHVYDPNAPITTDTTTLYASDRDVFMFLVEDRNPIEIGKLPNGDPDYLFRGFYVSNSEVGRGALKLAAFYLRAICCNRLLWGVEHFEELSIRHTKYAPDRFIEMARPALESFAEGSVQTLLDGVEKAKDTVIARNDEEAIEFLRARFSKKRAGEIIETIEREEQCKARSVWDISNGITAVARNEPNTDTRLDMELTAKRLLDKVAA